MGVVFFLKLSIDDEKIRELQTEWAKKEEEVKLWLVEDCSRLEAKEKELEAAFEHLNELSKANCHDPKLVAAKAPNIPVRQASM